MEEVNMNVDGKDLEKEFTLILLFNENDTKVLLQKKIRGNYPNCWNGVGGHLKHGETPLVGARREVEEETGISTWNLDFICKIRFYNYVILHCFCGRVNEKDVKQVEDEPLQWFSLLEVDNLSLAGDGNLPWLINESLGIFMRKGK